MTAALQRLEQAVPSPAEVRPSLLRDDDEGIRRRRPIGPIVTHVAFGILTASAYHRISQRAA